MPKRQHKAESAASLSSEQLKYINNSNNNNNASIFRNHTNNSKHDHFTLESDHNTSATINYECRFDGVASNTATNAAAYSRIRTRSNKPNTAKCVKTPFVSTAALDHSNNNSAAIYENLKFELNLSKKLLLHKFFHSSAAHTNALYENLCRGCGYGVFEARGTLCYFCQCIVSGVKERLETQERLEQQEAELVNRELNAYEHGYDHESSANIYENICEKCSRIYSNDECDCALTIVTSEPEHCAPFKSSYSAESIANTKCEKQLDSSSNKFSVKSSTLKLNKSKTYDKRDKRSIFHGLIGSLKRVKSATTTNVLTTATVSTTTVTKTAALAAKNKRPEIIHNVEGYEQVFRTQETFDLKRICELKRSQTSCSDQHIYGRLKTSDVLVASSAPKQLSQSHDQLLQVYATEEVEQQQSTELGYSHNKQATDKKSSGSKRPRLAKTRLLSVNKHHKVHASAAPLTSTLPQQSLYLPNSVCHWMTSLRREIHNYRSYSYGLAIDDEHIGLCNPKSIPAKNSLLSYAREYGGAVFQNRAPTTTLTNYQNIDFTAHRVSDLSESSQNSSSNCSEEIVTLRHPQRQRDASPVAQMVHDFKNNLRARQQMQQNKQQQQIAKRKERKLPLEALATATEAQQLKQRAKRQAIYLKIDDDQLAAEAAAQNNNKEQESVASKLLAVSQVSTTTSRVESDDNDNDERNENVAINDASTASLALSQSSNVESLVSRRALRQAITTSTKRCGIYERDSEFVNDILSAFETFLQKGNATLVNNNNNNNNNETKTPTAEIIAAISAAATAATTSYNAAVNNDDDNSKLKLTISPLQSNSLNTATTTTFGQTTLQQLPQQSLSGNQLFTNAAIEQFIDLVQLINIQFLALGLNRLVICYEQPLKAFLLGIDKRRTLSQKRLKRASNTQEFLWHKFQRFYEYCEHQKNTSKSETVLHKTTRGLECSSVKNAQLQAVVKTNESSKAVSNDEAEVVVAKEKYMSTVLSEKPDDSSNSIGGKVSLQYQKSVENIEYLKNLIEENALVENCEIQKVNTDLNTQRPSVPARDPKTTLTSIAALTSSSAEQIIESESQDLNTTKETPTSNKVDSMTVPTANSKPTHSSTNGIAKKSASHINSSSYEDDIYQPIWKFQTVGEAQERYNTDVDYYEIGKTKINDAQGKSITAALVDDDSLVMDVISNEVEDHGEWETDDEFHFVHITDCEATTKASDACSLQSSTLRSTRSNSSASGSTVTGFGSSTATLGSCISGISGSLTHHLFRNIGIFYSLTEPKLRAVIYDYDRVHAATYFAKWPTQAQLQQQQRQQEYFNANDSGLGKSPKQKERSPKPPPRTTSMTKSTKPAIMVGGESGNNCCQPPATPKWQLLPDSVQAWKFMLLDVCYLEDEEDMIVSESEILRAQEIKEDIEIHQTQQLNILKRFKSASFGNLIDIPNDDDKKSITERVRNKLQRGVFKINVRSPKSEKKGRGGIFRRAEATSLYLEDGMKPKYPIFGAPLEQLELNVTTHPQVPRFVVDCVEYIERKDCIQQDGLYRASGNKVCIDELKQKLSESYIYDPKLLVIDDIHTLTSLLKLFFRELGAPLIPQEIYERLGRNLSDTAGIESMRVAFEDMREPNHSTLKFIIKHLTNVAAESSENRMPASNLAIVWGPCLLSANQIEFDIGRMNTLAKVLIENYERIFNESERLVS